MIEQSLSKPSFSLSIPIPKYPISKSSFFCSYSKIRCESVDYPSSTKNDAKHPQISTAINNGSSSSASVDLKNKEKGPYPYPGGGKMGPYTGRDPNVKKPEWLRQRAPQGERFEERRVHPSDVEAAMEAAPAYPSKYVMLSNSNSSSVRPPPQRRNIPRYHSNHHHSHGHCCLKCVCCCLCFFIVVIIVLASLLAVLYVTLNPKMPQYNVESFEVNSFTMDPDFSLYTEFVVVVKSNNPNKDIAFTYGKDSSVVVAYSDSTLCSGKLPAFHQPFQNTTMIRVVLTGKSEFGSGLQEALMDNRETGRIPLLVIVKAPISVMVKSLALRQFMVNVNCSLVVDNLAPNKRVRILSSTYTYAFEGITLQI